MRGAPEEEIMDLDQTPSCDPYLMRRGLGVFLDATRAGRNLFHALTEALARGLGWRWAAVTRFTDRPGVVQMLGWWKNGHFDAPYDYEIAHTPCEQVSLRNGFCWFDDVSARFPLDRLAREHRIEVYAGQVYRDAEGKPLGHLIAAHDQRACRSPEHDALFDVLALIMGLELKHLNLADRLAEADRAALTDPLTGLGNRRAFGANLARDGIERPLAQLLAIVDLDGLKQVNDTLGHETGDALLAAFARELTRAARPHDEIYRLGGDEFAILAQGAAARVEALVAHAVAATRDALAARLDASGLAFGASLGIVEPKQFDWNFSAAAAEADRRMYAQKSARKAA
jgi:diguanylate cyclase (GGDEF)-like protein